MVPAQAEALVDIRLLPGQEPDDVLAAVQSCIDAVVAERPGFSVEVTVKNRLPAAVIPPEHRLVQVAQDQAERYSGRAWPAEGAGPANEGYMLIEAGIPTLPGFGPTRRWGACR